MTIASISKDILDFAYLKEFLNKPILSINIFLRLEVTKVIKILVFGINALR
jgi:hypothetical protein